MIGRAFYFIHKTSRSNNTFNTEVNQKMLITNVLFYLAFFASNVCYIFETEGSDHFAGLQFSYELTRILVEGVVLYLTTLFHANIHVKSAITQDGELLITGVDEKGKDIFNFYLKAENPAIHDDDPDSSDDS